jgi:glutamate synthase (NADPH) large chain
VDLDPVSDEDAQTLKAMIEQHLQYTGSSVAKFVLNDFENQLQHFVKVFPKDYKKALQSKANSVSHKATTETK